MWRPPCLACTSGDHDGVVLAFTAGLSIVTGVLFGLAPAIQGSHADLHPVMREAARSASAPGRTARLRRILVVGEFALALVLLVGAALLVQSFWRLPHVSLGFNPSSVLTAPSARTRSGSGWRSGHRRAT